MGYAPRGPRELLVSVLLVAGSEHSLWHHPEARGGYEDFAPFQVPLQVGLDESQPNDQRECRWRECVR